MKFDVAVVATGSIEQHLEHLAFEQDIASSTRIAEMAAERLYPQVVLAVPINVGIAEHHMHSVGTLDRQAEHVARRCLRHSWRR